MDKGQGGSSDTLLVCTRMWIKAPPIGVGGCHQDPIIEADDRLLLGLSKLKIIFWGTTFFFDLVCILLREGSADVSGIAGERSGIKRREWA